MYLHLVLGSTLLAALLRSALCRVTVSVRVPPDEHWKKNDCRDPLPDEVTLQCDPDAVIKITVATFERRLCHKVPPSCRTNITLAPQLCDGKRTCSLKDKVLKAENCALTSHDRNFVELLYSCVNTPDDPMTSLLRYIIPGAIVLLLIVLVIFVIVLWRRTRKLSSIARRQTLELKRATSVNTSVVTSVSPRPQSPPKHLDTRYTNREYDLDDIIIPVTPYSTEERGGGGRDGTMDGSHEYAEVDLGTGNKSSARDRRPPPRPMEARDGQESRVYLNLIGEPEYAEYDTSGRPGGPPPPAGPRGYADMNRASRLCEPPASYRPLSATPGYVRVNDVTRDAEQSNADRRSKSDGYFLASDFMTGQK